MAINAEDYDLEIPSFMKTADYERRRLEHLRQIEIEQERISAQYEKQRRYRLERRKEERRIKAIKRRRAKAVKIVLLGMTVIVTGSVFVNSLVPRGVDIKDFDVPSYEIVIDKANTHINSDYTVSVPQQVETIERINVDLSYEARCASINPDGIFKVGSEINSYILNILNNSEAYALCLKYGEMYGIDPYILIAKAFQESGFDHFACIPGGSNYNGYGVGILQHESPDGRELVAHNYKTGEDDVIYVTMENAIDLETNIKMGAMHFQNCLEANNGNLLLAIQNYNYGNYMMNSLLSDYAAEVGKTVDQVKSNYSDIGWLEFVKAAHENPLKYINNWKGLYGDDEYISHVLRYFIGTDAYFYYNGVKYIFNLNDYDVMEVTDQVNIIK